MHAAVAANGGMDQAVVDAVLDDFETAPIEPVFREALRMVRKLTLEPESFGPEHIQPVFDAGGTRQQVVDAMRVAVVFAMTDRLADTFGYDVSPRIVSGTARFLMRGGYASPSD